MVNAQGAFKTVVIDPFQVNRNGKMSSYKDILLPGPRVGHNFSGPIGKRGTRACQQT